MSTSRKPEADRFKGTSKWFQYIFARVLVTLIQCLPLGFAFRLGRGIGYICWKLLKRRRLVVERNLTIINQWNPQVSDLPIAEQVREVFQRSGANLIAGFPLSKLSSTRMEQHLEVQGSEHLKNLISEGKGAIMLLAHMGPWEALAHLPKLAEAREIHAPLASMYRPLNNTYLDDWLRKEREAMGTRLFSRRDGFHKPVDFLKQGGVLGILADQKMREGAVASYFGVDVPSSPIPGLFQRRTGAGFLALSIETVAPVKWRITINPVDLAALEGEVTREAYTAVCNHALEQVLSRSILDGFWFHKRFM
ncbi:MAG: lysophospholipid acyltransferase family protein [Opitutales bacterium]|jgi:Kdo2-lipid IVA lauroyltransferase/acyltransferase|nr:lysophospholipid acyltransferase family protein [Opitutales bacterium]MDP4644016.1 lysophospholipid acyltransferase family protein [Opitutales bacterium]MDP4694405.1 lysophospholipid acyltransferase family protein [Opitutales bacterium]MDP4777042.1 lysophospholipid acyltransferase family protein [Opitutales bacterium]MDP4882662.1 lysophospholipid acyltransferase family protein [Opitutales bacterium]